MKTKEKQTVFIKRYPKNGELPKVSQKYFTNHGYLDYYSIETKQWSDENFLDLDVEWWLEEIELPSEEELNEKSDLKKGSSMWFHSQGFTQGANFILNKLKGE